jgi:hypothetical protein
MHDDLTTQREGELGAARRFMRAASTGAMLFPFAFHCRQHFALRIDGLELDIEAPEPRHMFQYFLGLLVQRASLELSVP